MTTPDSADSGSAPEHDKSIAQQREGEVAIDASQLQPGVHVRLPVNWMDHPFIRSSFVVSDQNQVEKIAALNLPQLFSDPRRCTAAPLPRPKVVVPPSPEEERQRAELAAQMAREMADKQARAEKVDALRTRLDAAQTHYLNAAKEVGAAIKGFESDPRKSVRQMMEVSAQSAAVLIRDADSALALIAEKGHTDAHNAHALSVMTLALLLGKQARLPEKVLTDLGVAALLHDIGKVSLDLSLLRKPEHERSHFEETIYQGHCRKGHELAERAGCLSAQALGAVLHHHERADGNGYPSGLTGAHIPMAARIIGIANRFDNLTNPADPRRALSPSESLATMWSKEKAAFDVTLLQLFVRAMGIYPPGSLVQLSDGHSGVVVASAATESPLRPQVLIYEPSVPRRHAEIIDLSRDDSLKIERSLHVQERSEAEIDYLLPRRKLSWLHIGSQP
ncbi:metal dependent phosphohydrolase [Leptothrix cholodnii SP-6]|uniref:Metal dependent phosphohydrolase n=1 Tax=Leptothrix cholodnii (strain ATCC 51168 / LMG 8142 / SP-6) TaxID=395495 RepID=B1Y7V9_LEPCP|nr:HD domain-containing phosphohydrolase [Leptothrix cholodnii]ACB32557.1 metal dependent phosphohydrolase [Leptothrix cholodnii SP-6]